MKLRIKDVREDADLKQREVAEFLMCDQSLYSKYEREERPVPVEVIVKLAKFYHTTTDYLLGLSNEK